MENTIIKYVAPDETSGESVSVADNVLTEK